MDGRGGWNIETGSNAIALILGTWSDANVPVLYEDGNWTIVFFIGDPDKDRRAIPQGQPQVVTWSPCSTGWAQLAGQAVRNGMTWARNSCDASRWMLWPTARPRVEGSLELWPMWSWRSAVVAAFVSVVLLAGAGCSYLFQPTLTEKDVIGTWAGRGGARLTLAKDGTMKGVRVP